MKTNKAKRLFVAIVTMLLPVVAEATPANLSIEDFTINAGETKEMIIDLNNPDDQITLVQFDLQLPEGLSITLDAGDMIVDIVPGRTTTRKHSISANYQAENNITRVLLSSNTNATFSGTSGAIISISLTASSTFNGGTVKLKNQLLVTPSAVETKPADYSYTISGSAPETLEPYAALSTDHKTLTFYYDKQKTSRGGMSIGLFDDVDRPGWYSYKGEITTVEFDNSFANCNSITSTALWFADLKKLNTIIGIGNLNTSNVEDMSRMFSHCESLTSLDVSNFNTSKVEYMDGMFEGCHVISTLDLSNFDTSNVTCMECMFASCSYLSELNLSSFNTSKVTRMDFMFNTCWALTTLDLSGFDTSKVWDMMQMFQHCRNLVSIYVGDGWNVSNVTSSLSMFNDCVSLIGQDGTKYNANAANDATMAHYGTGGYLRASGNPEYELDPIDSANFGSDIDGDTNLDGNVVGDIYYNISSSDGCYDPSEGCIVITKPTDDSAISGQDIFGEDFQNGFTGIVFKVPAGKGTVKVEAQTTGTMVLKVKIDDAEPVTMELEGRLKASFPYNASEPTYVYIYGGSNASAPGLYGAPATGELKLYGIEVTSDVTGISPIDHSTLNIEHYYTLDGRKINGMPTQKGIYIINGKKVVIK